MSPALFIIIVGCGRLGSYLANKLSRDGQSVVIVDIHKSAFEALSAEYSGFRVEGDATEYAVLKQAKVDQADIVIATTRGDNVNLMVAQVAKKIFKVPRVMARVFDPKREQVYDTLGIETISPILVVGETFLQTLAQTPAATGKGN